MIAPDRGWAMNGLALYRTDDNGDHWADITTPDTQNPLARVVALSFFDAEHAWAAVARNDLPLTIYRTVDGGQHWVGSTAPGCAAGPESGPCGAPSSFTFIDPQRGWMFAENSETTGQVFSTVDGGRTWQLLGRTPFDGHIVFADSEHGWGVSGPSDFATGSGQATNPGGKLFATSDGGHSWKPAAFPVMRGISAAEMVFGLPRFFGRSGVVAALSPLSSTGAANVWIYTTPDRGASWTGRPAPADPAISQYGKATSPPLPFSAVDPSTWVLFLGPRLAITRDAGEHTVTVAQLGCSDPQSVSVLLHLPNIPSGDLQIEVIDFVGGNKARVFFQRTAVEKSTREGQHLELTPTFH